MAEEKEKWFPSAEYQTFPFIILLSGGEQHCSVVDNNIFFYGEKKECFQDQFNTWLNILFASEFHIGNVAVCIV
jgi:hypothetical protein